MRKVNYKSDFKLIEEFKDSTLISTVPFEFKYYTKSIKVPYVVSATLENDQLSYTNCNLTEDGRLMVIFDNHNLGAGQLKVQRIFELNDRDFTNNTCNYITNEALDIFLDKEVITDQDPCTTKVQTYYTVVDIADSDDITRNTEGQLIISEEFKKGYPKTIEVTDLKGGANYITGAETRAIIDAKALEISDRIDNIVGNPAESLNSLEKISEAFEGDSNIITRLRTGKQDKILDLESIRSGAAKGANALQSVPSEYITESELDAKNYSTKTYVDNKIADLVNGAPETLNTLDELAGALKDNADIVDVLNESISNKQDKISDLNDIRTNARKGATALQNIPEEYITETELNQKGYLTEHQDISGKQDKLLSGSNIKTINNQSILGSGNIQIEAGGITIVDSVDELDPNAPQGSLASVAIDTVSEVPFSELHQPTSDEVNFEIGVVDTTNLSRVNSISVNSSYDATAEIQNFIVSLFSKDIDTQGGVGSMILLALGAAMILNNATQEEQLLELFAPNEDGTITVNEENLVIINNLLSLTEFVYGGVMNEAESEFIDPSYADVFYKTISGIQKTDLYIKGVNGWEKFKTGSEVVNNLEEGGVDKALSAEMGKFLNEKIANIISGNTTEPIKFKGYVNVDNKDGIDAMFGLLSEGEACLVAPSVNTGSGDSYKAWVSSAINQEQIPLSSELFKTTHNITVSNVLSGKPLDVKTYLKLDEAQPHCQCPDMILLCKIKVKAKDFVEFVDGISSSIASVIPDSLMLTACIGKVLRWSSGDWLLNNPDKYSLTHKYEPYNTNPNDAWETGIIAYTLVNGPISGERFTVIVNASSDTDANGNVTAQQVAYGRTGVADGRVWTRVGFSNVGWNTWVEISNDKNILPNVNGWLLNPDDCLETGVYQTCNSSALNGLFTNNYFSLFVNASTTPNADGYDAIEQTAYGREADEGKIYRRVIFYHKTNGIKQYGEWIKLDDSNLYKELEYLTEEYFPSTYATKDEVSNKVDQPSRNLLINSNLELADNLHTAQKPWSFVGGGSSSSTSISKGEYNGYNVINLKDIGLQQNVNLVEGKTYTVSLMYRAQGTSYVNYNRGLSNSATNLINIVEGSQGLQLVTSSALQQASFTFVAKANAVFSIYANGNLSIACMQLEEGDTVTKYTRAEDNYATKDEVATAIANAITNTLNTEV